MGFRYSRLPRFALSGKALAVRHSLWVLFVAVLLLGVGPAMADQCDGALEDRADVSAADNPSGYNYDVYYTNDDPSDSNYFSTTKAREVRDALANTHVILVGSPHDFEAPGFDGESEQDTCIEDYDSGVWGSANAKRIRIQSDNMLPQAEPWIRKVTGHELFHHVQYSTLGYGADNDGWGSWVMEGTARYLEDKSFTDNDQNSGNTAYVSAAGELLGDTNVTLTDRSYDAALWWNYAGEQVGSVSTEPAYGVDFMTKYLKLADGRDPDSIGILRETLADLGESRSLESLYSDFQIANFTHDLDVSGLADADRYAYVDESAAGGGTAYGAVAVTAIAAPNVTYSDSVNRWAGRHFSAGVAQDRACEVIGFYGEADPGVELGWAMVPARSGFPDAVDEVYQSRGNVFYKAVIEPPSQGYDKVGLVVTGLQDGGNFDYAYGYGAVTGGIRLPFSERMARVGDIGDPPERFLVRLLMQGPAGLTPDGYGPVSVKGLDATLFGVQLRSDATSATYDASVLSARYVDGEYWLSVQAPEITDPLDGTLYDLEVCFCQESGSSVCAAGMTSDKSVVYESEILHQVLTVDRSYSMHYPEPAETAKITAAKNAARMFVDSASDDDFMTVATFTGNDTECDHDAVTQPNSGSLIAVAGNRDKFLDDINAIVEDGWTSIGDGIKQAAGELVGAVAPDDVKAIVLMSDGLENEGDFWATPNVACGTPAVRDSFDASLGGAWADMRIDTVAFGADADQGLLESMATFTGGLAMAVSTAAPIAAKSSLSRSMTSATKEWPNSSWLTVPNRLASAYRTIQESLEGKERLYFAGSNLAVGSPEALSIEINEPSGGGVEDPVFSVNWDLDSASVTVVLRDPTGSKVDASTAGWSIYSSATDKSYRYNSALAPGTWSLTLTADKAAQAMTVLSGKLIRGVGLEPALSQIRGVKPSTECDPGYSWHYLRGLPVTVLASLVDSQGAIEGATVEAEVFGPNGTLNQLRLYDDGAHDDGEPGDGTYGAVYTRTPSFSIGGVPDFPDGPPSGDWGGYLVSLTASGVSNFGDSFRRFAERSFHVTEMDPSRNLCNPDTDGDGLPDRWEDLYGLDKSDAADALLDPDEDGLRSIDEFFAGTIPHDPDTDNGGESDGSEVSAGRDPLYDRDDRLPAVLDYGLVTHVFHTTDAYPQAQSLLLRFPVASQYTKMHVYRQDPGMPAFAEVKTIDLTTETSGLYYDGPLVVGQEYFYKLQAEGLSGSLTPFTETFGGKALADPIPPSLELDLNHAQGKAGGPDIMAYLHASNGSVEMRISEDPSFGAAPWIAFANKQAISLSPGGAAWTANVYAQVRNGAGMVSVISSASIGIDAGGDFDGDNAVNGVDPDDDSDGLTDIDEIEIYGTNPFSSDTDGDLFDDRVEVSLGSDPLNADSTPVALLPALGPAGVAVLATLLLAFGLLGRAMRWRV